MPEPGGLPEELFAQRMRELREARGWSQRDLEQRVRALGVPISQPAIALIEGNERRVRLDEAVAIAAAFDVLPETLYRTLDWNDYLVAQSDEPGISPELAWLRTWKYQRQRQEQENQSTSKEEDQ